MAHRSRFHRVVGPINLLQYGAGDIYISLSKSKCTAARKVADPRDPDVAVDLAVLLSAGLIAEQLAQIHDATILPNPECAAPDHELLIQQLQAAGLSNEFSQYEAEAKHLLESQWELLRDLADYLFQRTIIEPEDVHAFIDEYDATRG